MSDEPRAHKSEDEILAEMERARKRTFIRETFYPALVNATVSVDEAGMLLQAVVSLIMEDAMHTLRTKKISEIETWLIEKLSDEDDTKFRVSELLKGFENMTLFEARGHFESMKSIIEQMKIDEMRGRKLDTMTPDWEKYLR